jgi:hypothetical protein
MSFANPWLDGRSWVILFFNSLALQKCCLHMILLHFIPILLNWRFLYCVQICLLISIVVDSLAKSSRPAFLAKSSVISTFGIWILLISCFIAKSLGISHGEYGYGYGICKIRVDLN